MKKVVTVKCVEDQELMINRRVVNACHNEFLLDESMIFEKCGINYDSIPLEMYYTICPNCGYMVLLDDSILSEDVRNYVKDKSCNKYYLNRRNELISELIHLDYLEKNNVNRGVARVRK